MFRLAVFVSGRGSNLRSLFSTISSETINAEIRYVVGNKNCEALNFASQNSIETFIVGEEKKEGIVNYSELKKIFFIDKIDLIVLAGYLKKIPDDFVDSFSKKIINIHPALLPLFGGKGMYGINVHRAVFNSGMKVSGATVHFVDKIYDNGLIIFQKCVDITNLKSPEEIAEKVLNVEHEILPFVVKKFAENKVRIQKNRVSIN